MEDVTVKKKKRLDTLDQEDREVFLHEVMMVQQFLKMSVENTTQLEQQFHISFRTVKRLWDQIKNSIKLGSQINITSGKIDKCRRMKKDYLALKVAIKTINYKDRKTLRLL